MLTKIGRKMGNAFVFLIAVGWFGSVHLLNRFAFALPRPIDKAIRWTHAMSFEGILFPLIFLLRPTGYFPKMRYGNKKGKPILLVHGYCHDSSAWFYLRRKLAKEGFGPIYVLNLVHPFLSIRKYAEKVRKKAEKIEKETKRGDLILIGHSMGGLVCSWYATKLAPVGKVSSVITIGTPLNGTSVARLGLGQNAREMQQGSEFIRELRDAMTNRSEFYQIGSKTDQLIVPSSSAWFGDNPERQFSVDDLGHLSLLFSRRVGKRVCSWLRQS